MKFYTFFNIDLFQWKCIQKETHCKTLDLFVLNFEENQYYRLSLSSYDLNSKLKSLPTTIFTSWCVSHHIPTYQYTPHELFLQSHALIVAIFLLRQYPGMINGLDLLTNVAHSTSCFLLVDLLHALRRRLIEKKITFIHKHTNMVFGGCFFFLMWSSHFNAFLEHQSIKKFLFYKCCYTLCPI